VFVATGDYGERSFSSKICISELDTLEYQYLVVAEYGQWPGNCFLRENEKKPQLFKKTLDSGLKDCYMPAELSEMRFIRASRFSASNARVDAEICE